MSEKMPEFPNRDDYITPSVYGPSMTLAQMADYERALRMAWEARARVAVEWLELCTDERGETIMEARHALELIGDLPAPEAGE